MVVVLLSIGLPVFIQVETIDSGSFDGAKNWTESDEEWCQLIWVGTVKWESVEKVSKVVSEDTRKLERQGLWWMHIRWSWWKWLGRHGPTWWKGGVVGVIKRPIP